MKVSIFLPTLLGSGAVKVMLQVCKSMLEQGYTVDVVAMTARGEFANAVPKGVTLVDLRCPRLWTSVPAFARYLRRERPSAVIAAMPLANGVAGWARLLAAIKTKLVMTEHAGYNIIFGDIVVHKYRLLKPFLTVTYRYADAIVAVSEGIAAKLRALPHVDPARIYVIYNPVYTPCIESLATENPRHRWLEDRSVPVILGVGRLNREKDFPTLIKAFHQVHQSRPIRLIILGEGEERLPLERLVKKLNLERFVELPGFVRNPFAWMAQASVFVLSSPREGLPTVLIEAMACGTPVVSTDCPYGPAEILENGRYGPLVKVGDSKALAEAIAQTLDKPISRKILKKRAQMFSQDAAAAGYLGILRG